MKWIINKVFKKINLLFSYCYPIAFNSKVILGKSCNFFKKYIVFDKYNSNNSLFFIKIHFSNEMFLKNSFLKWLTNRIL